ncbi:hypothetical protein GXM_09470 [Nostoc sphaeroides CCNUC1]|uniref:Uncharacterized protein n=1 Tax=Nostoc sphaeroides CCNUC1 TaxID=2653204 RepID=A0A5P8WIL3_9NOSO|nr:hypothetical protein GXM_09470 [Nostoc sphaeroides CCNUC1]
MDENQLSLIHVDCFSPREGIWLVETAEFTSIPSLPFRFSPREGIWLVETII